MAGLDAEVVEPVHRSLANCNAGKVHVYGVHNIVTDEVEDVHVVRLRIYANKDLEMTACLPEVFQHAFTQSEFEMAGIINISEVEDGQGFDVTVDWVGFDEGESSREPLATDYMGRRPVVCQVGAAEVEG